ncbi:MAG: GNAT family N-acetyltransferase [Bacteroidota bacterium]
MTQETSIRKVQHHEFNILTDLARNTFVQSFEEQNTREDMNAYVKVAFTENRISEELRHPNSRFYFACMDQSPIGYLKLNVDEAQTEHLLMDSLEIERIYVLPAYQNRKIGQMLLEWAIKTAIEEGFKSVWLGVWDQNARAISFYKRNGFVPFSSHTFYLGSDKQNDLLMKKEIT